MPLQRSSRNLNGAGDAVQALTKEHLQCLSFFMPERNKSRGGALAETSQVVLPRFAKIPQAARKAAKIVRDLMQVAISNDY